MTPRAICTAVLALAVTAGVAAAQTKKPPPGPVPGSDATWELKALGAYFRVIKSDYDAKAKTVRWTLETKDAYRTADFVRDIDRDKPFTFIFLDENEKDLATVRVGASDFEGIPKDRLMKKGTQLFLTLEVPNVLDKTTVVQLRRGAGK